MPPRSAVLTLADRRRLGYADIGSPGQPVMVYLHGNPGSRHEILRPAYLHAFAAAGLRVVAPDRPGFGDSDPPRAMGHAPLAQDLHELLGHLQLDRVTVVGVSRGALPALAFGTLEGPRVRAVGLFGPTGLPDDPDLMKCLPVAARTLLHLVRTRPAVVRAALQLGHRLDRWFPAGAVERLMQALPSPADRAQLREVGEEWVAALASGLRRDPGFPVDDWRSWLVDPLGFEPSRITVPVLVWTGAEDQTCPPAQSAVLAHRLPTARRKVLAGVGHLHTPALLVELMQATLDAGNLARDAGQAQAV